MVFEKTNMRVLFISSGKGGKVGDVVQNQADSLIKAGLHIDFFVIKPGLTGYLASIPALRRVFKRSGYDLAHAHYSLSAFTASLAGCSPLVVSLMGSDAFMPWIFRVWTKFFYRFRWTHTIVKTVEMKERLKMDKAEILPNGVDMSRFRPLSPDDARKQIGYPQCKKLVISISVRNRPEKNIELAEEALSSIKMKDIEFKHLYDIPNYEVPLYLNAADALLLTSKREGSVNVVKEAMACNCPVISTDVGDVRWVIGKTENCFVTSFDPEDIRDKIQKVIDSGKRSNGRDRILELGLDSESVAGKIICIYKSLIVIH
jgi:glycosyltransferase involved in cell wall biosynthesis